MFDYAADAVQNKEASFGTWLLGGFAFGLIAVVITICVGQIVGDRFGPKISTVITNVAIAIILAFMAWVTFVWSNFSRPEIFYLAFLATYFIAYALHIYREEGRTGT
jgi:hypothetical protein